MSGPDRLRHLAVLLDEYAALGDVSGATDAQWARYHELEDLIADAEVPIPDLARLAADMDDALLTLESMAHPVTGEDHDFLYDTLPALLARVDAITAKDAA